MLDDFLVRAALAGGLLAIMAGPLGCFIVWRRMAYFGDTLAHAGLLGVTMAVFLGQDMTLAVFTVAACLAGLLLFLERHTQVSSDALLGLMSHGALAIGLVSLSLMPTMRVDLIALLFGDILAVSKQDLVSLAVSAIAVLTILIWQWRGLLAATVSSELAAAEGLKPEYKKLILMLLLALVIALAMKIVGVLLITALLIIPAASARAWARSPEVMALLAIVIGMCSVAMGLGGSLQWDTPTGPSIVTAAVVLFALAQGSRQIWMRRQNSTSNASPSTQASTEQQHG